MKQASYTSDQAIPSAWQQGLSETSKDAAFKQALLQQEGELLPRFIKHYERLKALPRSMRRALQRQWRRSLAGLALLLVLGQAPLLAATINVGGSCTLVRAIVAANNDTTASGNCTKGSGADRIVLPSGSTQTLTAVNNTNYGPTGLPVIRSVITIAGNGSTIRRARSAPSFRIFAVGDTGNLTVQRTTVSGGRTNSNGGGVFVYNAALTLTNSTISGNSATDGGGLFSNFENITLTNSTISNNTASDDGGGVYNEALLTLTRSTISGNRARLGGGVYNSERVNATNSTVSGNSATFVGGGVYNYVNRITLTNCTITGNTADQRGGGIYNVGIMTLARTLISGNKAPDGAEVEDRGDITAANFNLFGHGGLTNRQAFRGFMPGPTDITATSNGNRATALSNILNTTLANNGGPTRTHALVAGSPAIDTVTDGTCPPPNQDQRGVKRPQDGNGDGAEICDTGSFERRPRE